MWDCSSTLSSVGRGAGAGTSAVSALISSLSSDSEIREAEAVWLRLKNPICSAACWLALGPYVVSTFSHMTCDVHPIVEETQFE